MATSEVAARGGRNAEGGGADQREPALVLRTRRDRGAGKQPGEKIAKHAYYTFWWVLPIMPMLLLMPRMRRKGIGF